jgi:hypothetical protein
METTMPTAAENQTSATAAADADAAARAAAAAQAEADKKRDADAAAKDAAKAAEIANAKVIADREKAAKLAADKLAREAFDKLIVTVRAKVNEAETLLTEYIDSVPPGHVLKPVHVRLLALVKSLGDDVMQAGPAAFREPPKPIVTKKLSDAQKARLAELNARIDTGPALTESEEAERQSLMAAV